MNRKEVTENGIRLNRREVTENGIKLRAIMNKTLTVFSILCSHSGDYEWYELLYCNAI